MLRPTTVAVRMMTRRAKELLGRWQEGGPGCWRAGMRVSGCWIESPVTASTRSCRTLVAWSPYAYLHPHHVSVGNTDEFVLYPAPHRPPFTYAHLTPAGDSLRDHMGYGCYGSIICMLCTFHPSPLTLGIRWAMGVRYQSFFCSVRCVSSALSFPLLIKQVNE
jgi:hypothetical protein